MINQPSRVFSYPAALRFLLLAGMVLVFMQQTTRAQDTQAELKKMTAEMQSALDAFCLQARKINGTVSTYELDGDKKKLINKCIIKADKSRYLTVNYNGEQRFLGGELYRDYGDIRQVIFFDADRVTRKPRLRREAYVKKGEKSDDFLIDDNRVFAYDYAGTFALRPVPWLKLSILDLFDYPALKVTAIDKAQAEGARIVKVTFTVDQEVNAKQSPDNRITGVQAGWIELRPDQFWTMHRAELTAPANRQRPGRKWTVNYVYDPAKTAIPLLKEIKLATIDQKENAELKPISQLHEFDIKIVDSALPDDQFSLTQFELPERTPAEWLKDEEVRIKKEQDELKAAPTPAGGFPIANGGLGVNPWVLLGGGLVAFLLFMIALFRFTGKKKNPA